jgi:putative DNA primase/helicase
MSVTKLKTEVKKIDFDTALQTTSFPHVVETRQGLRKLATIANLKHLFSSYGITVSYDEMLKEQVMILGNNYDNAHSDLVANSNLAHLQSLLALNGLAVSCMNMLPAIFAQYTKNPIIDWIKSKKWDGYTRIADLANTLKVEESEEEYRFLALKTWLIQCVAAADGARHTPRKDAIAKFELVFILQGGQGARKTSWFGKLLPKHLSQYMIDGVHLDPADKDSVKQATSCWICELGELDSTFKRADISRLKAFLSKKTDTLRLPYDRATSQLGRRTSFGGSVNPEQFLSDNTGSRRFLPVQIISCDSLHNIDMQQLWAQVWDMYIKGEQWWCSEELEEMLKTRHERHSETVPLNELIAEIFDIEKVEKGFDHRHYTATRILTDCGIKEPKPSQANMVNSYLKKCGFKQVQNGGVRGYWLEKRPFMQAP